ncbi:MAG TPA: amidohydrolase [Desulfobacteraceae bacterium]|nr:amidohydrolase [Deltaproteobacteria bacterium]HDI61068.1 amidohydrolase [Desulfobacteraceae bacterium]
MDSNDLVIYNGIVMTVNPAFDIHRPGMVVIRDGCIVEVGPWAPGQPPPPARQRIDAEGGIVMPGLVNTHTHLPMTLFRGLADDLPLMQWLESYIFPAEARHINARTVDRGTRLACAELLLGGTTCCCDGYFLADQVAEAAAAMGLRGVIGQGVVDFPAPGVPDAAGNVEAAGNFVNRWQNKCSRIHPAIFCHSPYACGRDTLVRAKRAARAAGCLFQIHVAETEAERRESIAAHGLSPVAWLEHLGIWDDRSLAVHAVWVDRDDIAILARRRVAVSHNPQSNMKLASGVAPVPALLEAGITVGLGTDGCASNNDLDLLREMDTAAKLHKVTTGRPTVADARQVVEMATSAGARAIGLGDAVGSLEPGKRADIVVLHADRPHLVPVYHPASTVVYAATAADVRHVLVDGQMVVHDGILQTADVDQILADVRQVAARIVPAH